MMGGQPWLSGSICTSHFAALDSNPKGNIHDLLHYYLPNLQGENYPLFNNPR